MPASDGRLYAFKYVNGHPKNTAVGLLTVTAFGVLADVQTGYPLLLSELTADDGAAHRGHLRARGTLPGAPGEPRDGAHRQRRAERVPDRSPSITCSASANCGCSTSTRAPPTSSSAISRALRLAGLKVVRCASTAAAVAGADIVTTVTADKCNATILTPADDSSRHAPERRRRRLPRQDRAAPRRSSSAPTRAWWWSSSRSRASRARSSSCRADFPVTELTQVLAGRRARARERRAKSRFSTRWASRSRTSPRCAICMRIHQRGARRAAADRPGAGPRGSEGSVRAAGAAAGDRAAARARVSA